jgi:hypothetical protein
MFPGVADTIHRISADESGMRTTLLTASRRQHATSCVFSDLRYVFGTATAGLARNSSESFVEGDYGDVDFHFAFGDGIFGLQLRALGVE